MRPSHSLFTGILNQPVHETVQPSSRFTRCRTNAATASAQPCRHARWLPVCLLLWPQFAQAEIREISPQELTESYIRDTTVIIRRERNTADGEPHQTSPGAKATLRVSPADKSFSAANTLDGQQRQHMPPVDKENDYSADINSALLDASQDYTFSSHAYDVLKQERDSRLRNVLNPDPGTAIDYSDLQFPTAVTPDGSLPPGSAYTIAPAQFSISIPNSGNYPPYSFRTPGGEYQVDVTPDDIVFTINLPD